LNFNLDLSNTRFSMWINPTSFPRTVRLRPQGQEQADREIFGDEDSQSEEHDAQEVGDAVQ
jgi:hypothetical protein